MQPTDDVCGPHDSAIVIVMSAIDVLHGVADLRAIYPGLPALDVDYGNVLDEVAFALSVGEAINPWFKIARTFSPELDKTLRLVGFDS